MAEAAVRLPRIFSDHMVIQRDAPVAVWGWDTPGESVTVRFANQTKSAAADAQGKWSVTLDPLKTSAAAQTLEARDGGGAVVIHDVLVGEVWLASGQSNMHFPMFAADNAAEVLPNCADDQLRMITIAQKTAVEPLDDVQGKWEASDPAATRNFSAVAYFFARELREKLKCPVGIVHASWGGTPIQTWISLKGLQANPPIQKTLDAWDKALAQHKKVLADPKLASDYRQALKAWQQGVQPAFNAEMKAYNAAKASGSAVGARPKPSTPEPSNPDPMGMPSPSARPNTPTVDFNGMIAPLAPYSIRGVIWYQGEANGSSGLEYRDLFPRLIEDWRNHWQAQFPFLFVQIPAGGADRTPVAASGMPWTREAQLMTLREPRTAMAITIDIGNPNDPHPTDKIDVGHRLALVARRDVYGEHIVASGPLYASFSISGPRATVRFTQTGSGLMIGQAPWRAKGVEPLPTERLIGFYVAGADRKWAPADAVIDGNQVIVTSKDVPQPVAVRYGWANSPRCNLYNREGLSASPFRTDAW
ncbi:MAG: sialate O-acetylesterase [Tepidisphaeraceae bacterium]